jgi:hypothetical protein
MKRFVWPLVLVGLISSSIAFAQPRTSWDQAKFTWVKIDTLLNNGAISNQYRSNIIDFRLMGGLKNLFLKSPGGPDTFYVALDGCYSATADTNGLFRFRLGGSNPWPLATATAESVYATNGYFMTLAGSVKMDSTRVASAYCIPLVDSLTHTSFDAPYGRVHIWVPTVKKNGIWAVIMGRGK